MSSAEARRRCPQRGLRAARPQDLPGVVARGCGRSCARWRRWSSRSGSTRATSCCPTATRASRPSWCSSPCASACGSRARWASRPARSSRRSRRTPESRAGSPSSRPAGRRRSWPALPVRTLPGVGPKAEVRLVAAGVATIGALAELDDARLAELLPGPRRRRAAAARAGDRPAPGERRAGRGHLDLQRGDVRRGRARPRGALRPPAADGRGPGGGARAARHERADRDDEGALPRLRDRDAVAQPAWSASTTPRRSATWRAACSTARYASGRGRSGWWAWGCPGSTGTGSSRCRSTEDEPATP